MPPLTFIVEDEVVPIPTAWGLPVKKVRIQSHCMLLSPMSLSFTMSREGTIVWNSSWLKKTALSHILTLNANFKGCRESGRVEVAKVSTNHLTHFMKVNVRVTGRSLFIQLSLDFLELHLCSGNNLKGLAKIHFNANPKSMVGSSTRVKVVY